MSPTMVAVIDNLMDPGKRGPLVTEKGTRGLNGDIKSVYLIISPEHANKLKSRDFF